MILAARSRCRPTSGKPRASGDDPEHTMSTMTLTP